MRREGRRSRPQPTRVAPHRVLIVCGARNTESQYLTGLRDSLDRRAVNVTIVERAKAPDQVVSYTRKYLQLNDFDEVWCVVDTDHYEREGSKISAAVALAGDDICLAISNPCFEYWLLLHHDDCAEAFAQCDPVERRLRRYLKGYDKTQLRFADFAAGLDDAVKRAKKRDPSGREHRMNPSTGMWRLVERIVQ